MVSVDVKQRRKVPFSIVLSKEPKRNIGRVSCLELMLGILSLIFVLGDAGYLIKLRGKNEGPFLIKFSATWYAEVCSLLVPVVCMLCQNSGDRRKLAFLVCTFVAR